MTENLRDKWRVFNTRNNAQSAAAFRTGLDIDCEHPLETLHPAHGGGRYVGIDVPGTPRHDALSAFCPTHGALVRAPIEPYELEPGRYRLRDA